VALNACSSEPDGSDSPRPTIDVNKSRELWKPEFDKGMSQTQNPKMREVLSDYEVSEAELQELAEGAQQCVDDLGISAEINWKGGFGTEEGVNTDEIDACTDYWQSPATQIYDGMKSNPYQEDQSTIVFECLQRIGLVPDGYSRAEYDRYVEQWTEYSKTAFKSDPQNPDNGTFDPGALAEPTLAPGVSATDPDLFGCLILPKTYLPGDTLNP
jgi:hypothetical protein